MEENYFEYLSSLVVDNDKDRVEALCNILKKYVTNPLELCQLPEYDWNDMKKEAENFSIERIRIEQLRLLCQTPKKVSVINCNVGISDDLEFDFASVYDGRNLSWSWFRDYLRIFLTDLPPSVSSIDISDSEIYNIATMFGYGWRRVFPKLSYFNLSNVKEVNASWYLEPVLDNILTVSENDGVIILVDSNLCYRILRTLLARDDYYTFSRVIWLKEGDLDNAKDEYNLGKIFFKYILDFHRLFYEYMKTKQIQYVKI